MAANPATLPEVDVLTEFYRVMTESVANGGTTREAAERTITVFRASGKLPELLDAMLPDAMMLMWYRHCHANRFTAPQVTEQPKSNGRRRGGFAHLSKAENLYDVLYCAGGRWIPLGDCTRDDCAQIAELYRRNERTNRAKAEHFERLMSRLDGPQKVRDRWKLAELVELFS